MAKRPTRSQANDATGATPSPRRGRRTRSTDAQAAAPPPTELASQATVQGRHEADTIGDASPEFENARPEAVTSESVSMGSEPSEDDIRLRAYHRYLARGSSQGTDFEDWLEAERELRHR